MRIIVTSDTHGDFEALKSVVLKHTEADALIHLGDGASEAKKISEEFPDLKVLQVRGNCDVQSKIILTQEVALEGRKIFMTHGHLYGVKNDIYRIYLEAQEKNADIVLFGHTHQPFTSFKDGVHLMNPGSLNGANGSYGMLDITPSEIITNVFYPFKNV